MNVILQKDVKDLGKVGDLVAVSGGFARNYLFPRRLAVEASERRVKEFAHLKLKAAAEMKKALDARKKVLNDINGKAVVFKLQAGENDKLFGTVTSLDISNVLEKMGFSIDRRDIHVEEAIKVLGQHKAIVRLGEGLEATLLVSVERA